MSPSNTSEPMIVYVTEKGCDLNAVFPDLVMIEKAMRNGTSWYDLEQHTLPYVKPRPFKVVVTTEAELARIRAPQQAAIASSRILTAVRALPETDRTYEALIDFVATECAKESKAVQPILMSSLCEQILTEGLMYTPPAPPVTLPLLPPSPLSTPGSSAPSTPEKPAAPETRHRKHMKWIVSLVEKSPKTTTLQIKCVPVSIPVLNLSTILPSCAKTCDTTNSWKNIKAVSALKAALACC